MLIAASLRFTIGLKTWNTLTLESNDLTCLRSGSNLDLMFAINRRNFNIIPQRRLRVVQLCVQDNIVTAALEYLVRLTRSHHIRFARRTAHRARFAFVAHANLRPIIHPRRDIDRQFAGFALFALAIAGTAWR